MMTGRTRRFNGITRVVFPLFLLSIVLSTTRAPAADAGNKTFKKRKFHFSFIYPGDWLIIRNDADTSVELIAPATPGHDNPLQNTMTIRERRCKKTDAVADLIVSDTVLPEQRHAGYNKIDVGDTTVGTVSWRYVKYAYDKKDAQGNVTRITALVLAYKPDDTSETLITVKITSSRGRFAAFRKQCETILNTLKISVKK